eukprot:16334514-Heterocapsa_arctica.AAC.1
MRATIAALTSMRSTGTDRCRASSSRIPAARLEGEGAAGGGCGAAATLAGHASGHAACAAGH